MAKAVWINGANQVQQGVTFRSCRSCLVHTKAEIKDLLTEVGAGDSFESSRIDWRLATDVWTSFVLRQAPSTIEGRLLAQQWLGRAVVPATRSSQTALAHVSCNRLTVAHDTIQAALHESS